LEPGGLECRAPSNAPSGWGRSRAGFLQLHVRIPRLDSTHDSKPAVACRLEALKATWVGRFGPMSQRPVGPRAVDSQCELRLIVTSYSSSTHKNGGEAGAPVIFGYITPKEEL